MLAPSVQCVAHLLCFPHLNNTCILSSHFLPLSRFALMLLYVWAVACAVCSWCLLWRGLVIEAIKVCAEAVVFLHFSFSHTKQPRSNKTQKPVSPSRRPVWLVTHHMTSVIIFFIFLKISNRTLIQHFFCIFLQKDQWKYWTYPKRNKRLILNHTSYGCCTEYSTFTGRTGFRGFLLSLLFSPIHMDVIRVELRDSISSLPRLLMIKMFWLFVNPNNFDTMQNKACVITILPV